MQKIATFLWFDNNLEEAIKLYTSVFKNAKITGQNRLPEGAPGVDGNLISATFEIEGQSFMAINGGPEFKFTEAISIFVNCEDQAEVDYFWDKLSEGGEKSQCGWLKDRFGLSWQIIPKQLQDLLADPEPVKGRRVMEAMLKMSKLDIAELEKAHQG